MGEGVYSPLDPVNANRYAYTGADPINNTDPQGLLAGEVGINFCYVFCLGFGATFDADGNADADVTLGAGGKFEAAMNLGITDAEPGKDVGGGLSGGCSAEGLIGGYGNVDTDTNVHGGLKLGAGGGCSIDSSISWPLSKG